MKLKQLVLAAALAASAPLAFAHGGNYGNQGGAIGGGAAAFGGAAYGSASSSSTGNAAAGSEVIGSGYSIQAAGAISGGSASIGGSVNYQGAQVQTSTTQYAVTGGFGATDQAGLSGNVIENGNSAFASSNNSATGNAVFGVGEIAGIAGFGSIGNW